MNVSLLGKGMNTDVTFSKEDEARNTPALEFGLGISRYLGGCDLDHPDLRGIEVEELVNEVYIL